MELMALKRIRLRSAENMGQIRFVDCVYRWILGVVCRGDGDGFGWFAEAWLCFWVLKEWLAQRYNGTRERDEGEGNLI